jgi:general secretion pathway protein E
VNQQELELKLASGAEGIPALADWVLQQSARAGASDLHLEPRSDELLLRWRVDGCLADAAVVRGPLRNNLIQRIKVLAGLLTYRTDIPQDGRIAGAEGSSISDMRVSVYPAVLGEKIVVRFFHKQARDAASKKTGVPGLEWTLAALGLNSVSVERLESILARPQGMLLLTGPAGSGKTTTLYAALKWIVERSQSQRQIVTIEDPVERILDGVTHTELRPVAGLDYPAALKSLLRQDPEVIMIGEIRDGETAQVAVQAALTGHLILSTVHAPSAPEVLLRLLHLGVEPYLVASVVSAVLEQRLVRKLCACRKPTDNPAEPVVAGACENCGKSGFSGRLLIAELLFMDELLRAAVLARTDAKGLMNAAAKQSWQGLWVRGMEKVAESLTTTTELRRVLVRND